MCHTANNVTTRTNIPPMAVPEFAAPSDTADHHASVDGETAGAVEEHHLETPELIRIAFYSIRNASIGSTFIARRAWKN